MDFAYSIHQFYFFKQRMILMTSAEAKIKQLQHQSETWKRDLGFVVEENIALKNRLAEIIAGDQITPEFLERIEAYQNEFISKDEALRLIFSEIKEWDKFLVKERYLDGSEANGRLIIMQKSLSRAIEFFMNEFNRLKFDFNNYLSETL
jgi:hypothetical protein